MHAHESLTAFAGTESVASGDRAQVSATVKALLASPDQRPVLVFDDSTGAQVDLDLREIGGEAGARQPMTAPDPSMGAGAAGGPSARRKPGRPRLGVVGREVTLLPRHWEWLNAQPGGASVALRKLVENARRDNADNDRVRRSQESAFRFMSAVAGNETGFEEASRSLFAGDQESFERYTETWPAHVRDYARGLAGEAFRAT